MNLLQDHLLTVITFTPLVGAVLLMAIPAFKRSDDAVRWVANIFGTLGCPCGSASTAPPPASSSSRRPRGSRPSASPTTSAWTASPPSSSS